MCRSKQASMHGWMMRLKYSKLNFFFFFLLSLYVYTYPDYLCIHTYLLPGWGFFFFPHNPTNRSIEVFLSMTFCLEIPLDVLPPGRFSEVYTIYSPHKHCTVLLLETSSCSPMPRPFFTGFLLICNQISSAPLLTPS